MNTLEHHRIAPRLLKWLTIAWMIIIAKCVFVQWAILHWQIPFASGWIVAPTLTLASVATVLLLVRSYFGEPQA
jgi:hypothetical protein